MPHAFPIRPEVRTFTPYVPGLSIDEIREKFQLDRVIKLASNENPLGTSPLVQKVLRDKADVVFRYTQSGNPRLVAAIAESIGVDANRIVVGNGSDEVIDLLIRCCPTPGVHNIVVAQPCFSLYLLQAKLCGVALRTVPLHEDFSFNWQGMLEQVDADTALVFITTPDNPSGYCPPLEQVRQFARALPPTCLLVVDEAYMDFCDPESDNSLLSESLEFSNLVLLRTFSKSYGLAGLRIGYGVMPAFLAAGLCAARAPFSVNILAEEAAITALRDEMFREATLQTVWKGRKFLTRSLQELGCFVWPSQANFIMFAPPSSSVLKADAVFNELLKKGVIIRPLKNYGLPGNLRVSIGTEQENKIFLENFAEVIS